ncbi:death-inducer obliterator 1-like isoform X2 [Amphibalanus amphitrite]|uniref:death-inducer obliterator 1-like isoform X2 n=1 Tax=Amphibalanus amphitrite TaxID=1232801 RepID=UPI001C91ED73|nr:death-inducer obliterator 1-like isoform X2 [Amphibalanus amphitrite]XP_043191471.1 death-inducer obliterator 1-like isoform X2 [Amphibalanus amphitrite]XP_043191472.1 death-inducer obliterator 1-like isoform X2 [Amphibalanus amphitrite]
MVMSGFSQLELEKRLAQLKDTADSIQTLSAWCLKHKHQHRRIVNSWLKILKRAKVQQRLPLFYLANDVIQYSKRKNLEFVPSFQTVLEGAMPLVRDEKLRPAITRILNIWDERGVFEPAFTSTLRNVVSNVTKADTKENAQILSDFRTSDLINHVRQVETSEKETDQLLKAINDGEFHVSDTALDELRNNIKSRSQSNLFVSELEEGVRAVERYVSALDREIQQRAELIEQLERSEIFYETQRTDAKVVAVAYKNFSKRVRDVRRKLEELVPELPDVSPVPSPDMNAPSPTNSDDGLQLPDDAAAADSSGPDPRSEIERLLGSWTGGGSGALSSTDPPTVVAEDGAEFPAASSGSFLGMGSSFPANLAAELLGRSADTPPPVPPPPPPQLSEQSAIAVVTGVQQGGTFSSQNTPLADDNDFDEDTYESGASGGGGAASQPLSDLMRLIGRQLQPPPAAAPAAAAAAHIPGLDLTRPPPALPDVSQPPPPVGAELWPSRPPPALHADHPWQEDAVDAPCSPPPFEKGNSAYNSQIDLPPAFKAVDEARLPFSADTDHRVLPTVPPPAPAPVPPPADLDLRQPPPVPVPAPVTAPPTAAASTSSDHGAWDKSVDDFISQVTEDRDYRRRADADYRPPPTDLPAGDDHDSHDMDISDGEREGAAGRRASGSGTPGRAARRHSSGTPGRGERARPAADSPPPASVSPLPSGDEGSRREPELVDLEDELPEVTAGLTESLEAVDDPSVSSWSSSADSPEPAGGGGSGHRSRHRSGEKRKKRHRRDSGGRRRKKERRTSRSQRRERRSSGDRRRRSRSDDRSERRKSHSKKHSRDRSRSRDKSRGRDQERGKGKSRDRDRHHSRGKGRSRERGGRDRSRSRSRSRDRRQSGGGGSFDYSQVGAGAMHRDRAGRRW